MTRFAPETQDPNQSVVLGAYASADLLVHGLQTAGACPTRTAFITNLRATHNYNAAGLVPGGIDLGTNKGVPNVCLTFVTVNSAGTAFQLDPSPNGGEQWCGTRLSV